MEKQLNIGDKAEFTKQIKEEEVVLFAKISGDDNPVHLDEEFAKQTMFKQRIAHGFLVGSLISAGIAKHLPGNGTIYLNQSLKFMAPVFLNDTITAYLEVLDFPKGNQVLLSTICKNQDQKIVIEGTALVMAPKTLVLNKPTTAPIME
ncbi:MAG: MaoC family dehydratase [Bacteroidota bacterium]